MKRSYIKVGKRFGENPNPKKEQEIRKAIKRLWIDNCPLECQHRGEP